MTRPKTRTAQLDQAEVTEIKTRFGTLKNAFLALANTMKDTGPLLTQDVFSRVAAGRPSLPVEVITVRNWVAVWKKANLRTT